MPDLADSPPRVGRLEGHFLNVLRARLEVIQIGVAANGIAERGMRRHIADGLAVDIDLSSVAQRRDMLGPVLDHDVLRKLGQMCAQAEGW